MKKFSWILFVPFCIAFFTVLFPSCKKINEATELGNGLIPAVDNINTFDTVLEVQTNNRLLFNDSSQVGAAMDMALGNTNDPVFGATNASMYFDLLPPAVSTYPFFNRDSLPILDSVVLSLSYKGAYGDTTAGSTLSVEVSEIAQGNHFNDSPFYRVDHTPFATTGPVLGTKTMAFNAFKDSVRIVRKPGDTIKTANELRIRLDNSFGNRFLQYSVTTAYKNDTAFRQAFNGLAVKGSTTGKALGYFNLSDLAKSKMTFYYRVRKNGVIDTNYVDFIHDASTDLNFKTRGTRANFIQRTRSGDFQAYLTNGTAIDDKLFIQAGSPGSAGILTIPGLTNMSNRIVHLAELTFSRIPSAEEAKFPPPPALFLDRVDPQDVGISILDDIATSTSSSPSYSLFGGRLRPDSTYRFNITRHVQGIVSRAETNYQLRVYAPVKTIVLVTPSGGTASSNKRLVDVLPQIAYGRVVLGGGNFADASKKVRLRIVYSRIR
ncbi:MAG: hypothetical protein JWP27_2116 [Flaviaesturariibacter sp.]|nr:hypothetical protein [Flaviaesturariibacter sp.]